MKDAKTLPHFDFYEEMGEFFDTHDMGEYDLPEVEMTVNLRKRAHRVSIHESLLPALQKAAQEQNTSTEELVNAWLSERLSRAA